MQIQSFAKHPKIIAQHDILYRYMKCLTWELITKREGQRDKMCEEQKMVYGVRTSLATSTFGLYTTNMYQMIHKVLLMMNDRNRFLWIVIRSHFRDLYEIYFVCCTFNVLCTLDVFVVLTWRRKRLPVKLKVQWLILSIRKCTNCWSFDGANHLTD